MKWNNYTDNYDEQPGQPSSGEPSGAGAGTAAGTAARMKEQATSKVADVKQKVSDLGRQAADKLDESRESTAGALEQTASSLHASGDKLSGAAHSAADKLQAGADYVRQTDLRGMGQDVQDLVKRYPGLFIAEDPEAIGGGRCFSSIGSGQSAGLSDHLFRCNGSVERPTKRPKH